MQWLHRILPPRLVQRFFGPPPTHSELRHLAATLSQRVAAQSSALGRNQASLQRSRDAIRAALKATAAAAEHLSSSSSSSSSSTTSWPSSPSSWPASSSPWPTRSTSSPTGTTPPSSSLLDQCRYDRTLLAKLAKELDAFTLAVNSAANSNDQLSDTVAALDEAAAELKVANQRLEDAERRSKEIHKVQEPIDPPPSPHRRRKRSSSPALDTLAESLTDRVVKDLAALNIYPNALVYSRLNPKTQIFVINTPNSAANFISTLLQISARNKNAFGVLGMDVEYSKSEPATIQLAFSADIVAIFQIYGICGLSAKPNNIDPSRFPAALKSLLESPHIRKAGVSLYQDCIQVRRSLKVETKNTSDCQEIAKTMGVGARSLASLYYSFVDQGVPFKDISKEKTGFSWESSELELAAIEYAANDALASLLVYRAMVNQPNSNSAPWDKSLTDELDLVEEERRWKGFLSTPDKLAVSSSPKTPEKPEGNSLPSSHASESDMMTSFTQIPGMGFDAPPTAVRRNPASSPTSTNANVQKPKPINAYSRFAITDLVLRWNKRFPKKHIKPANLNLPREFEQAALQSYISCFHYDAPSDGTDISVDLLHMISRLSKVACWNGVSNFIHPQWPTEVQDKIHAILLSTQSEDTRRVVAVEMVGAWFQKRLLLNYEIRGGRPFAEINRELAIDAPLRESRAKSELLLSGLEMLSPSASSVEDFGAGGLKEEIIRVWERTYPTSSIRKTRGLPSLAAEFELALFKAAVASGDLHSFIHSKYGDVFVFYLMKVIGKRWDEAARFLPSAAAAGKDASDAESTTPPAAVIVSPQVQKLLDVKDMLERRSLSIDVIVAWIESGLLSNYHYVGAVPSVAFGSPDNALAQEILGTLGADPGVTQNGPPALTLFNKTIEDIRAEFDDMPESQRHEWRQGNLKFKAELHKYGVLLLAFETKFRGDVEIWNQFFDPKFETADWGQEDGFPTMDSDRVDARLGAVRREVWGVAEPMSLTRIYFIVKKSPAEFGIQL
ncbi:hypothetical protein HDU98_003334 [Podochytrium sp. JEL0797]|nr:hypothetical protein HDU98_003334 [Podochytrium sp. JEL0797]